MLDWMFPIIARLSLRHSWRRCLEGTLGFTSNKHCFPNAAFVRSNLITLATDCWTNCEQSREQLAAAAYLFWVGAVKRIERPPLIPCSLQTNTRSCLVPFRPPKRLFSDRKAALSRCGSAAGRFSPIVWLSGRFISPRPAVQRTGSCVCKVFLLLHEVRISRSETRTWFY